MQALACQTKLTGRLAGLHRHSARHWIEVYQKAGFEGLFQFNYGTNKSELEAHCVRILQSFAETPPMNAGEAKSRIETLTGISLSPSQVRAFMKRHGLRYMKTGHIPAKADPQQQQQWVQSTLYPAIQEAQNGKCHLLLVEQAAKSMGITLLSLPSYSPNLNIIERL